MPTRSRHVRVPAGGDLQHALDTARRGDWIELQSGATYTGPFRLRRVDGDGWIVLTSSPAQSLPAPGTRVEPDARGAHGQAACAASGAVITADPGAHHYPPRRARDRADTPARGSLALVQFGADEPSVDRCRTTSSSTAATCTAIPRRARGAAWR